MGQPVERSHASISPSGLSNFEKCPGFLRDDSSSIHPVTQEGTLLHDAIEKEDFSGLTKEQMALVNYCLNYAALLPSRVGEIIKEPKLQVIGGVYGYADQVQVLDDSADVLDWKMGWNRVAGSDTNPQGQAYALGVFNLFPGLKEVTVHFVQPRLGYVSAHCYTREDAPRIEHRIRSILSAVDVATPEDYRPCAQNCEYCSRYNCPAVGRAALLLARGYAESKDKTSRVSARMLQEPEPKALLDDLPEELYPSIMEDPEEVAKALAIVPIVEAWARSAKNRARQMRVDEGIEIPGWELAHRKAVRKITSGAAAWDVVKDRVSIETFAGCCTPSLPKVKAEYTKFSKKGQKAADGRLLETRLIDRDALSGVGGDDVPYLRKTKN